jgi:competence protein ComEA
MTELFERWRSRLELLAYHRAWILGLALALAIVLVAWVALAPKTPVADPANAPLSAADLETAQEKWLLVYVNGAVRSPGLYRLQAGQRVIDALVAAGGATPDADPSCLPNLAGRLSDGKTITVPQLGHCLRSRSTKLDINSASREQLLAIPGMDPGLADAILAYRQQQGGFLKLTELKSELGLDATTYKQLARYLRVP